jgi:LPXTG-motif cell wall-anchored protein
VEIDDEPIPFASVEQKDQPSEPEQESTALDQSVNPSPETEEIIELEDEELPLGSVTALPQTGETSSMPYFGLGFLLIAGGLLMRHNKRN